MRRLTAAIVVNDRMVQPATGKTAAQWQPHSVDELRNLTALAQAAVGFDSTRGDVLTVEDIAFDENRVSQTVTFSQRLLNQAEGSPLLLKYTALIACLLLVLALGIRPALRQMAVPVTPRSTASTPELSVAAPAAALAAAQPSEADQERIRAIRRSTSR